MSPPGPDERKMLTSIQAGEQAGRLIYADWLETQGRSADAAYVRAELALLAVDTLPEGNERQAALATAIDALRRASVLVATDFRAWLSRPAVEKCSVQFTVKCPQRWSALASTNHPRVRACNVCLKNVVFCATVAEARALASRGLCVAVDFSQSRTADDLEEEHLKVGEMAAPRGRID
jgi:uncharacterized protein (TIGR02996 family)